MSKPKVYKNSLQPFSNLTASNVIISQPAAFNTYQIKEKGNATKNNNIININFNRRGNNFNRGGISEYVSKTQKIAPQVSKSIRLDRPPPLLRSLNQVGIVNSGVKRGIYPFTQEIKQYRALGPAPINAQNKIDKSNWNSVVNKVIVKRFGYQQIERDSFARQTSFSGSNLLKYNPEVENKN